MRKIFLIFAISLSTAGVCFLSCSKSFLDRKPSGVLDSTTLANQKGVEALLIGAYSLLDGYQNQYGIGGFGSGTSNWVYGSVSGGEGHKGSDATDQPSITPIETYSSLATNDYYNQKWRTVYEGVSRCNIVLKTMAQATDISDADQKRISGEARFLRAFYHFEAKKLWNNIPFIDETQTSLILPSPAGSVTNTIDSWPLIQADAQYAFDNLPELQSAVGRANKWAAAALLGKILVFQKKWAEAETILLQVYNSGKNPLGVKYALLPAYQQNFDLQFDNSAESVFAYQSSANDNSGASNGDYGDVLNMPYNGIPFTCCGFFQPSQDLVNSFKVDATTGLPDPDNYNTNPVTIDLGQASFTPYAGTLDSRLDWTVGRRGIPFLDWAVQGGTTWQRDANYSGPYSPKKNLTRKSQQETYADASFWNSPPGITALNVNLIRFADVILLLAECEVELGGAKLENARTYVNMIRTRAADPVSYVYKFKNDADPSQGFSTTPAADYKVGLYTTPWTDQAAARKAVHFERKLELGMEGHRFFDLVRWGEAQATLTKYIAYEGTLRSYLKGATFTDVPDDYFPIPQRQIDLSGTALVQNPGY